ncbi:DeoR family transcriptional regulator [Jeongeupia sp. HS-3]|uniref:DeoR/GlpR family DNA-binding transcription regulator n=1 Tax=Jeongeupia sp. HS-3 TaxID=1009682 RepID=UPI0018A4B061|nr:DeoR/GlpR family DNA-binding transcription regulator [Jeongeupia sp. HS-3]BCL77254.1 DeoR family transcriptional regulator [Jeongeupia sp. HS-3]
MFTHERQQRIVALLADQGRASVADLATTLAVSDDTIRRDLNTLAALGLLQKTHGGALSLDVPNMRRGARAAVLPEVKQALGRRVAALVTPGQTLMLDAGNSLLAVAQALPDVPLTVITHSLDIAQLLSEREQVKLILLGGEWDASQRLFRGATMLAMAQQYRADLAIMGACAIHPTLGVTASDESDGAIKRAFIAGSARSWLVSDHSKFGEHAPYAVAPLDAFERIFTDRDPQLPLAPNTTLTLLTETTHG